MEKTSETALLLVAHGSRAPEANAEMLRLAQAIEGLPANPYATVASAFLQWGTPSVDDTLDRLAADGYARIVVLPCLLAAGRHVAADIPQAVEAFRTRAPGVAVGVASHLALAEDFPRFLLAHALAL